MKIATLVAISLLVLLAGVGCTETATLSPVVVKRPIRQPAPEISVHVMVDPAVSRAFVPDPSGHVYLGWGSMAGCRTVSDRPVEDWFRQSVYLQFEDEGYRVLHGPNDHGAQWEVSVNMYQLRMDYIGRDGPNDTSNPVGVTAETGLAYWVKFNGVLAGNGSHVGTAKQEWNWAVPTTYSDVLKNALGEALIGVSQDVARLVH